MTVTRSKKKAENEDTPDPANQPSPPAQQLGSASGGSGLPTPPGADNPQPRVLDAPSSLPAASTSATGRKRKGTALKIVVNAPKTNVRVKRRRSGSSDGSEVSPPQQSSAKSKRAKLAVPKESKGKAKASDNEHVPNDTNNAPSNVYPTPVSAQFPQTPSTAGHRSFPRHAIVQIAKHRPKPKAPFSLINTILKHPELILHLAKTLEPDSLIDLYAISKPFHFVMNSHYTTYIKASMENWAPHSNFIFPWRCYARLCVKDPGFRPTPSNPGVARDVPSLRWLQMVAYRHKVIREILLHLAKAGFLLPAGVDDTMKKIWFTMDLPGNANRIGVIHNQGYWLDKDLFLASMFFMKLDMRLTDPVEGTGELHLRKLLLGMRNLVPLRDLLYGEMRVIHLLQRQVWYCYQPSQINMHQSILGIRHDIVGNGNTENWGRGTQRLIRVDECVMREGIRRALNLHQYFIDFMLFGYVEQSKLLPKKKMTKVKDVPFAPISFGRERRLAPFGEYRFGNPGMESMARIGEE
jgi:hypothetical protein